MWNTRVLEGEPKFLPSSLVTACAFSDDTIDTTADKPAYTEACRQFFFSMTHRLLELQCSLL